MFKTINETKWGSDVSEAMTAMIEMAIEDCLNESIYAWDPLTRLGGKFDYLWLNNQIGGFRMWLISDDQEDDDCGTWLKEFQANMARCGFEIDGKYKKVFMYDYDIPYVKYSELPILKEYRHKFYHELDITIPLIRERIEKKYEPGSDEMKKLEEHFNSLQPQ